MKKISVVVCCYNSVTRISKTLEHLLGQKDLMNTEWEILVVDNNSTDNTGDLSSEILKTAPCSWKIIYEKQPGLTSARRAGHNAAIGEYIVYCDDDNWLGENYLKESIIFLDSHKDYGAVGGVGEVVADTELPSWFSLVASSYACDIIFKDNLDCQTLTGAGLVIRRSCLCEIDNINIKLVLSDRTGAKLTSGGDSELTFILHLMGWKLAKISDLKFQHFLPSSRLTLEYAKNLYAGLGSCSPILSAYNYTKKFPVLVKFGNYINVILFWVGYRFILYKTEKIIKNSPFIIFPIKVAGLKSAKESASFNELVKHIPMVFLNSDKAKSLKSSLNK